MWQWILSAAGVLGAAAVAAWAGRRGSRDSPYEALAKRVTDQEDRITELTQLVDTLRDEVREARASAREHQSLADTAVIENIAWADHHLEVMTVVAMTTGPWPRIPHELRHRISPEDYPTVPLAPRPPDDGQDEDPTQEDT